MTCLTSSPVCDYNGDKRLKPLNRTHVHPRKIGVFFMSLWRECANKLNKHTSIRLTVSNSRRLGPLGFLKQGIEAMKKLVISQNNQAITTSLKVAEVFNKTHKHVLENIDTIIENLREPKNGLSQETAEISRFFSVSQQNLKMPTGGIKKNRIYTMTRDGFTLLAMGFTGKKALQFKLAYIDAFNRMEETLKPKSFLQLPTQEELNDPLRKSWFNVDDKQLIEVLNRWYGTRHYNHVKAIETLTIEKEQSDMRLRAVEKAIHR